MNARYWIFQDSKEGLYRQDHLKMFGVLLFLYFLIQRILAGV
jgi:hypothetical protein